jgi:predicted DNA-binding antitoxin AbrB/MazE fold protein
MIKSLEAIFDGQVLHPQEPVELEPNTRVRITIETVESAGQKTLSFLQLARSLNLEGPTDWSARFEDYLYGSKIDTDE